MSIFNRFGGEFVDIIEWIQSDNETMVYRFPRYKNEIKYGAKLTVREGQTAILVNEGKIADVFAPGIYELKTANLPILSTLQNWQHGFESPFKAEVYFFNSTDFIDIKWGTRQPVALSDAQFGIVRLRAFGSYTLSIHRAETFLKQLVGTDGNFEITEVSNQLTNAIVTCFPEVLAESAISVLELPTRYSELAEKIKHRVTPEFNRYGLQVGRIYIENISLPENVQKVLDEKTGMNIIGENLNDYAKYQTAQGLAKGDKGNLASVGVEMAMGMEMGRQMTQEMQTAAQQKAQSDNNTAVPDNPRDVPPPPPGIYYLMVMGQRQGPMPLTKVYHLLEANKIDAHTLIWRKGMSEWQAIESLSEIDLSHLPPPLQADSKKSK